MGKQPGPIASSALPLGLDTRRPRWNRQPFVVDDPSRLIVAGLPTCPTALSSRSPRVLSQPPRQAPEKKQDSFIYSRQQMWVEAPREQQPRAQTARGLPSAARSGSTSPRASPRATQAATPRSLRSWSAGPESKGPARPKLEVPAEPPKLSHSDLWEQVVLPSVSWLYGWIDWHVRSVEDSGQSSAICEQEHRAALQQATKHVSEQIVAQADGGLAACIWRSMVALLTHFITKLEPSLSELHRARHELEEKQQLLEQIEQLRTSNQALILQVEERDAAVEELRNEKAALLLRFADAKFST